MPTAAAVQMVTEYELLLEFLALCPIGLAQFNRQGDIVMLNPAFSRIAMPLLVGRPTFDNILDLLQPYAPDLRHMLESHPGTGTICNGLRVPLGPTQPGQDRGMLALTVVRYGNDELMAVLEDVTRQVGQERKLKETEAYFAALVQGVEDYAAFSTDGEGRIIDWNVSAERMFGRKAEEVIGQPASGIVTAGRGNLSAFRARLREAARDGWHLEQGWRERADGVRFWGTCMLSPVEVQLDGQPPAVARYLMVVRDTTEQRNASEELQRALTTDHLTGVLNRRTFFERAEAELARQAARCVACSVAMIDADHFKSINDTHGHAGGDAALRAIANTLRIGVRAEDLVGRLGGEEFAVLMPDTSLELAGQIAERLRAAVADLAVEHAGEHIAVTVSVGLASARSAALEPLLSAADGALYAAKRAGRNRLCNAGELATVSAQ